MRAVKEKKPLRKDLYERLRKRIATGAIAPGTRLKEAALAEELGVSRTPLREALLHLERDGLVRSDMDKGFSAAPLSAREAQELYPILWTLEALALSQSGASVTLLIPELEKRNSAFKSAARHPAQARAADSAWHQSLVSRCPNRRLLQMIEELRLLVARYERIYMQDREQIALSVEQHAALTTALREQRLESAAALLETNWRLGMESLLMALAG